LSAEKGSETPNNTITVLEEPFLEFRYSQRVHDPRDGLSLFGPVDVDTDHHPRNISYGLVGTRDGITQFKVFSDFLRNATPSRAEPLNRILWPVFPGFETAYNCVFPENPTRKFEVNSEKLMETSRLQDANQRAFGVVQYYLEGIKDVKKGDEQMHLVICVVPEEIYRRCRAKSIVEESTGEVVTLSQRRNRAKGQNELFATKLVDSVPYNYSINFRRQLKARAMMIDMPIQIIRDTTLRPDDYNEFGKRGLTPLSDRAWNLSLALFYKAGGMPWRLGTARPGVCYVGLVYKRTEPTQGSETACCAAQMFLESGNGVVLRSDFGPWYSPKTKELHLDYSAAKKLLSRVLSTYQGMEGKPLKEVFLHYRSSIDRDEWEAFKSVCPSDVKIIAVRVREDRYGLHLYREGKWPILRGTVWKINDRMCYLWGSGFKPRLETYDGAETPVPLRIEIQYVEADILQVAKDILGLTKLNFNECKFGDSTPVTIGFSRDVGEILVSNPLIDEPSQQFKYYI
jgi:hypothetical protein